MFNIFSCVLELRFQREGLLYSRGIACCEVMDKRHSVLFNIPSREWELGLQMAKGCCKVKGLCAVES